MPPQSNNDTDELPYGDSRDNKNYHEDDEAYAEMHNKVINGTMNLGPKMANAFMERVSEEQPTKKTKLDNGAAATTTSEGRESVTVLTTNLGKRRHSSIVIIDELGDDDDDMMEIKKEGHAHYVPSVAMTGVEPNVTRLCAAISGQIYHASSLEDFNLSNDDLQIKVEIIMFDTHAKLEETTPPFVVVVMGKTMICGWRGSSTLMDWVMDFAFAPVVSSRWIKSAKSVRAQGAYTGLIESELSLHEDFLIANIKERGIEDLVLTGHSLAGGLAQVAHLSIEGSRGNAYSPWSSPDLASLTVRSVAFSAPMTTVNLDRANDPVSVAFVNHVGSTMCNVIYESDPVPRGYANLSFIQEMLENAIPQVVKGLPIPRIFRRLIGVQGRVQSALGSAIEGNTNLLKIAEYYRHIGKVIYYEDDESKPETFVDKGFHYSKPEGSTQNLFYDIKYKESDDVFTAAKTNHMFLVAGPGLAYGLKKKKPEEGK